MKRKLEVNDKTEIRPNKNFNSLVIEVGGYENLSFLEKDRRNYIKTIKRLKLKEEDVNAIQNYILKMEDNNSNILYVMDLDYKG